MRTDMKKVLCERPRTHSSDGYHDVRRYERRGDDEDGSLRVCVGRISGLTARTSTITSPAAPLPA